jgi:hypothetical protein
MELENEYCSECQKYIRKVFDKDAYELGQVTKQSGNGWSGLDWTTDFGD